ncbi:MAG: FAD-dependent oxidoreductase [Deltaproteobacteria bacterium]|nr:FAD-dependent oxidoreductase [Deltaproteobacteria bacterium]
MAETVDCVVIGGGPAGSTAANLLASHGHDVLLLEREHFPRYHVGESLLPGVLPMLDVLGAREAVEAFGFQKKSGQTFCWNPKDPCWELNFHDLERFSYTWFVTRADFDQILLETARTRGARVREGCRVRDVRFEGERAVGVTYEDDAGQSHDVDARYVVDATGSQSLLAKRFQLRRFTETMKSFAVWSYYRGFERVEAPGKQHLLAATFRDGWIWCIPLHDGRTSIGVVTARDLVPRGLDADKRMAWYEEILRSTPEVAARMGRAERVDELRVARDWSYRCTRRSGPGWALAGEAAGFIDPLLSYGIQFAMNSSYLAALAIHNALDRPDLEEPFFQYFEDTARTLYEDLFAAVEAFYSYDSSRDSVYWRNKELVGRERGVTPYRSFLYVSAGFLRNEALDGLSEDDSLSMLGLDDAGEARRRTRALDASVPGALQPDVLVGGAEHVAAHGVPVAGPDGEVRLHDLVREGFELRLTEHEAPPPSDADLRLLEVDVALRLPDGRRAEVRVFASDRDTGPQQYTATERLAVGYRCTPRLGSTREHEAVIAVVDHVTGVLDRLDAEDAPREILRARLIDALGGPDPLPEGASLLSAGDAERPDDRFRALVLALQREDDPRDGLIFFLQDRQVVEEKTWTRTRSFTLSYQPSHLLDGTPLFESPPHRAACAFVAERLHRLDDRPGQGLDELAARLQNDLGTRMVPPTPWRFGQLDGISASGAPEALWTARPERVVPPPQD